LAGSTGSGGCGISQLHGTAGQTHLTLEKRGGKRERGKGEIECEGRVGRKDGWGEEDTFDEERKRRSARRGESEFRKRRARNSDRREKGRDREECSKT
jgi:hypothetical protein